MAFGIEVTSAAHAIQMALTPVFLLTGIGSLMGVLTNRLSRIVDRYRALERVLSAPEAQQLPSETQQRHGVEMETLTDRSRLIHRAIGFCTLSALLVCLVVAMLFIGALIDRDLSVLIAILFTLTMGSLILGLFSFIGEINLATGGILIIKRPKPW
jgi:Cu/Ag efflux pump CusA